MKSNNVGEWNYKKKSEINKKKHPQKYCRLKWKKPWYFTVNCLIFVSSTIP
jgi:hypothetical protein